MPDHFTRGLTVRVHRSGAVYVLEETDNGQIWRLDRAPDRRPTHHD
jgi:glucose/arabinose dehydrogenase